MTTPPEAEPVRPVADRTPAEIVPELTRAQRKAIINATWNDKRGEWRAFAMFPADRNLRSKGLTNGMWAVLTPLGLAVREALAKDQPNDR